ncbi:hypothetical protein [Vibrio diabolicus]|uniref:hypothetical protein n=1 Tax=Vibrio diabolicus TaxID=50719 RepID=UPI00215FE17F|nr:hypothetical protein [Vibrio diabolicus]MCS0431280.1 hypothetical protein [Vibrio diabolicus]
MNLLLVLFGIMVLLTIFLFFRNKLVHAYLDEALERTSTRKNQSIENYKRRQRKAKHQAYFLWRYERIKHSEALMSIPPHYTTHLDGSCRHYSKIEKCFVVYFSGLENRYVSLLLDKHNTRTNDNQHAIELNLTNETWTTVNRSVNGYDDSPYVVFNLLKEEDINNLRAAGVKIMMYNNSWGPEVMKSMPSFQPVSNEYTLAPKRY